MIKGVSGGVVCWRKRKTGKQPPPIPPSTQLVCTSIVCTIHRFPFQKTPFHDDLFFQFPLRSYDNLVANYRARRVIYCNAANYIIVSICSACGGNGEGWGGRLVFVLTNVAREGQIICTCTYIQLHIIRSALISYVCIRHILETGAS